ncbi:ABC transporter permease subunit [Dactylosporangium vinaceum]|uniref:ABC transporter permease subunit n=1 Tax=Dactylosporangium vinaceum TaxID=53362 RepID=A0ABV5MS65_9ACTN|nr:ABC transporter permease subunit [Dactylosporangium vinaceum]UAC00239.1 ABC transporter permease subunit [Dactylosporangium vinaceum]
MLPALVRKTWSDDRRALLGWAVGIAAVTGLYTSFYRDFAGVSQLKQAAVPQDMLDFLGIADLTSPAGYLQATVFSLIGPLLVLLCAITLAARTIAGPEEDGGLELLLTVPVTRIAFAAQRLAATAAAVLAVAAVPWLLLLVVVPSAGMAITLSDVSAASFGLTALAWCFAGIAFLVGAATGRRGTVLAVSGALAVLTYIANALGGVVDGLAWLRYLSPFHYAFGTDPLHTGWHPGPLAVLVVAGAVTATAGVLWFNRRDIAA